MVANPKLKETIMAKLWALFNYKQRPMGLKVDPLESGGNKRSQIHKENKRNFQKVKYSCN